MEYLIDLQASNVFVFHHSIHSFARSAQQFRQAMLDKFASDDRIEQMNAQKRRMKQQEHKQAVEELIAERRRRHEFEKEQERKQLLQRTDGIFSLSYQLH